MVDVATFVTSLAGLVTALTALLKVIQVKAQGEETHATLKVVDAHTNGQLKTLQQSVVDLRGIKATQEELDARPAAPPKP